jgi:hypothetical protein
MQFVFPIHKGSRPLAVLQICLAVLVGFAACHLHINGDQEKMTSFVDGTYFQSGWNHYAIGRNDGIEVKVLPSGMGNNAYFVATMTNTGSSSNSVVPHASWDYPYSA